MKSNPRFALDVEEQVKRHALGDVYDLVIGSCEDIAALECHGVVSGNVDTVLSIQVLCSISGPEATLRRLYELLKPGGTS